MSKTGTITFQPTYTANGTNNKCVYSLPGDGTPPPNRYDANGNLTTDTVHSYAWDSDGNTVTMDSIGLTFDALDRMVEQNRSGSYTQIVYGPGGGKLALMNGQTLAKGFAPLSGGDTAVYTNGPTLSYYRHGDWLGSSRFASLPTGSSRLYYDGAYAPYGENYAEMGTTDRNFTGQNQDTISSAPYPLYDFLSREQHPVWGRWLSPDPAGLGAVDPSNPQAWNLYAYVTNNPLALTDPLGLVRYNPPYDQENYSILISGIYARGGFAPLVDQTGAGYGGDPKGGYQPAVLPIQPQFDLATLSPAVISSACFDANYAKPSSFIAANLEYAQEIASQLLTNAANILGLSGLESGWGFGSLITAGTNNYFSLTAGPAFGGTIGTYQQGKYTFGEYPSPGFLTSGESWANSYLGNRVSLITDPLAFAQALNAHGSYNSESLATPFANTVAKTINLVNALLSCPK